jgi:hypothetical protein
MMHRDAAARNFLLEQLRNGPVQTPTVRLVARRQGFTLNQLRCARKALGIVTLEPQKRYQNGRLAAPMMWALPAK